MTTAENLKKKITEVSQKVLKAEKAAEAQIHQVVQKVDVVRKEQLKKARELMDEAKKLKSKELMKHVDSARQQIEEKATLGIETVLKKLNLPTNKDIDRLTRKIAALEKRLKDLDNELYGK
jgi:polyhydroxyalkanoate synthesis regulator phasin